MTKARTLFVALAVFSGLAAEVHLASDAAADAGHTFSIADQSVTEGSGNATATRNVTITVNRAPQSGETLTVDWNTAASGAGPTHATPSFADPVEYPEDYKDASGTATFTDPVATTQTIPVPIFGDTADENNEQFRVLLSNPGGSCSGLPCSTSSASITDGEGFVTITDDDATPTLKINDITKSEGADAPAATTAFDFTVTRTGGSNLEVSANYATTNDTAVAPGDYAAKTGTVALPTGNGDATATITITVNNDSVSESNESFFVTLSNPQNATLFDAQGVGTITDDEAATANVSDARIEEGGILVFDVTLSKAPAAGQSAIVNYATADGTATVAGNDYTPRSGSITFGPNDKGPFKVNVQTTEDTTDEATEVISLNLSKPNPCGCGNFSYEIGDGTGAGVIQDDDGVVNDFNGDGHSDAVFGVPGEDVGKRVNAGSISVIYGDAGGISPTTPSDQVWHLNSSGVVGSTADQDRFGSALAFGDFNSDGFADIAVGVPGWSGKAGAVSVLYGSSTGLKSTNNQLWTQNSGTTPNEVEETSEAGDGFGTSLAGGDFNGDGFDDLAAGVPGEDVVAVADAGAVNVLLGSASGLTSTNDQLWSQDPLSDDHEAGDRFGSSVAASDLNGDGRADLLVGVPGEDVGAVADAGAANAIYGGASGLAVAGNQVWNQETTEDASETGDAFGFSVATGDINGDGFGDAVFGVPREDITTKADAGGVNVVYGSSATGLVATGGQFFSQDTTAVEGTSEADDLFGYAVAIGGFNADTRGDLVIGAPLEDISNKANAGSVNVLYGSATNLSTTNNQLFSQDSAGIISKAEKNDLFGVALSIGDYNGDDRADLLIGARSEDLGPSKKNAGVAHAIYGAVAGLSSTGNEIWHQDIANVGGGAEKGDGFGTDVA